jgi:hypothetical protein
MCPNALKYVKVLKIIYFSTGHIIFFNFVFCIKINSIFAEYCIGGYDIFEDIFNNPFGSSCHHNETEGIYFLIYECNYLQKSY